MARIAARNGRLYSNIASGGTAEPIAFISGWTFDRSSDRIEVTAMGDANKTFVAGLPNAQGTYSGFYDTATAQFYTAASDGVARKFYLYPDQANSPGTYWFGTAFFDQTFNAEVAGAVQMSGNWSAATDVFKVG